MFSPTVTPRMSACSCISNLLDVIPPSTCSWARGTRLSWFIASRIWVTKAKPLIIGLRDSWRKVITFWLDCFLLLRNVMLYNLHTLVLKKPRWVEMALTSLVWKQTASRAAKAKWLLLVNWVSPQMILEQSSFSSLRVSSRAGLESIVKAGTERVKRLNSCFTLLHLAPSRGRRAPRRPEQSNNHRTFQLLLPVSLRLDSEDRWGLF